jgi:hypothetical protein
MKSTKKGISKGKKNSNKNVSPLLSQIIKDLDNELSKKNSYQLDNDFITNNNLSGYIKKELNTVYSFIDNDNFLIKIIFTQNSNFNFNEDFDFNLITLKKYKFDFLVYKKENNILYKLICIVEDFDIDSSKKKNIDSKLENVNHNIEIKQKSQQLFTKIIKDLLSTEPLNINLLTASNFINNNYTNNNNNNFNIFNLLLKSLNIKTNENQILLKEKKQFTNENYLYDDIDSQINNILKNVNWKNLYSSMPSYNNIKKGLKAEKLNSMLDKINNEDLTQNELLLDVNVNKNSIKEFLEKKTKRMIDNNLNNFSSKLPTNIINLINEYGDVMANVGNTEIEKMKRFNHYNNNIV